jgi:peptidoglycan/xylan/chitin deacetylase (PgdA/CDA1 family)
MISKQARTQILLFHAISDVSKPHMKHVLHVPSIREFESFVNEFSDYFLTDIHTHLNDGQKGLQPAFLLTFDDGLREVHEYVAKILRPLGIKFIFFVNSAFVGNRDMSFRFKISLIIDHFEENPESLDVIPKVTQLKDAKRYLYSLRHCHSDKIEEIASKLNISFREYLNLNQPYMNEIQIRELINEGHIVGAHSHDHPEFRFLNESQMWAQISKSVHYIKRTYGVQSVPFAFPFTDMGVSDKMIREMHDRDIYPTYGTAGLKTSGINGHFQRIPMEISGKSLSEVIHAENMYQRLRNLLK